MGVILRPYQEQAVYLTDRALNAREHPLCVLPTGSGKSLVLAALLAQRRKQHGRLQALVLSHIRELLEQDSNALRQVDPSIPQGFYSAGLKQKRGAAEVVFGSIQTVYRSMSALGTRTLLLIDEAHLAPRESDAMYAKVFAHFSLALRAGFTATNQRLDTGSLTEGDDAWFSCISTDVPVGDLIKQGYLVPLVGVLTEQQAVLDSVGTRGGDFIVEQAERAVNASLSVEQVIVEVLKLAARRSNILIFAAGVKHAEKILDTLKRAKVEAEMVIGDTPSAERDAIIAKFRAGKLRVLVNVGVLTTGFDAPQTDCIVSLRPTMSPILWQQIMGRGMRIAPRKQNCLLLDFVGNLERLGGAGCVVEVLDNRQGIDAPKREQSKRRALAQRDDPIFNEVSLMDPMKSGASFDCKVKKLSFLMIPSRKLKGKNLLIAIYKLEDDQGNELEARSFVSVEFAGAARFFALKWFARRGMSDSEQVPTDARTALALAKVLPVPSEVRVFFDQRYKAYLVLDEFFAASSSTAPAAQASMF